MQTPAQTFRSGLLAFYDRLVPPVVDSSRAAEGGARRWGAQLPLGILVYVIAQLVGFGVGIETGLLIGETTREDMAGAGASSFTLYPVGVFIGAVVTAIIALAGYWGLMRFVRGRGVTELAGPGRLRELGAGLGWGTALMAVVFAVLAAVGSYRIVAVGWDGGVLVGLAGGIMAGFAEELLFRGVLLRLLEAWLGSWWALGISAVVFGAVHLGNPGGTMFGAVAIVLEGGILLGACYLVMRRLWFAIGLHAAWNFVQGGVFGSDISGTGSGRGLFQASFTGPDLLTGGSMGVEGSLVAVVICTAAGLVMAVAAHRRGLILPPAWRRRRPHEEGCRSASSAAGASSSSGMPVESRSMPS
mgnify:FL=1